MFESEKIQKKKKRHLDNLKHFLKDEKAQQKYKSSAICANQVTIHARPDCCFERIDYVNVMARDSSLHHMQRLDHLVDGRLCGNTGTSRVNGKAVVRCLKIVFGRYLVLQVTQGRFLSIGEVDIMVKNIGKENVFLK